MTHIWRLQHLLVLKTSKITASLLSPQRWWTNKQYNSNMHFHDKTYKSAIQNHQCNFCSNSSTNNTAKSLLNHSTYLSRRPPIDSKKNDKKTEISIHFCRIFHWSRLHLFNSVIEKSKLCCNKFRITKMHCSVIRCFSP